MQNNKMSDIVKPKTYGPLFTVTHGCIIATVQLFHPDGREARPK